MALIDQVYQTVQNITNIEQRGLLTPGEFNNLADKAQNEIFEQYFSDYNFFENASKSRRSNSEFGDISKHLREKINRLLVVGEITHEVTANDTIFTAPSDLYRLVTVSYNGNYAEEENHDDIRYSQLSPLGKATAKRPVYTRIGKDIRMYGLPVGSASINASYIRNPKFPKWTYTLVDESPVFNDSASDFQDFEIHLAEKHELINKILRETGIILREDDVVQAAEKAETQDLNNEFRMYGNSRNPKNPK